MKGILPDQLVTVVDVKWIGNTAVDLTYKDAAGRPANELLYRHGESTIEIVAEGSPWSFDGDGALFRLVSEAQRIRLAYLFDPLLAVHTSMVDPLPHQITAVYGEMLPRLLQNNSEMFDTEGHRRKLVVFSEHRDTLNYLNERTSGLPERPEAIVTIHGGMGREERRKAQNAFTQDKEVEILIATDAASEGINLQRAHLMVNYDLPWNPNRLEQRFGRIHRIGQTEVCHLWNLVAKCTREGEVYLRLLENLDQERQALGGQVFDILGQLTFDNRPLRELLLEAVRYGDRPEVRARLHQIVEKAFDHDHIRKLIEERALTADTMDASKVRAIREDMERAEARRLQPHFIATFFSEAFKRLGGKTHDREPKRFEITNVPAIIRNRDRAIGHGSPVMIRYERITFEKDLIALPGKALADFVCPGHPLLDATIDLTLERNRDLLRRGAVLVDETDPGDEPCVLVFLEHSIQDARKAADGRAPCTHGRRIVSKQMQFVEITPCGAGVPPADASAGGTPAPQYTVRAAGYAPYLDYRPLTEDELRLLPQIPEPAWLRSELENSSRIRHPALGSVAFRRGAAAERKTGRQDRRRGQGPADPGDSLLGPPCDRTQGTGIGR